MALKYNLRWKTLDMPVRLEKSTKDSGLSGYGIKATYVCPKDEGDVRQVYVCKTCNNYYTKGDLPKRRDADTGIVFMEAERKEFMRDSIEKTIVVEENGEIPLMELAVNMQSISATYEIYNNDSDNMVAVMQKIYNYMIAKGVGMLCNFGYYGRERGGLLMPANDRILLCEIRGADLIKPPKQIGLVRHDNPTTDRLKTIGEDNTGERYMEFLEMVKNGVHIEVKPKEEATAKAGLSKLVRGD
ncbi:MAG: hypothetical protein ACTSPB_20905 [Candidatus Thorarchaeota archaeon]